MKCSHCKFWRRNAKDSNNGVCDKMDLGFTDQLKKDGSVDAVIEADASDDSGLYAHLVTTENFFCAFFIPEKEL